jgi:hypothetical protein
MQAMTTPKPPVMSDVVTVTALGFLVVLGRLLGLANTGRILRLSFHALGRQSV